MIKSSRMLLLWDGANERTYLLKVCSSTKRAYILSKVCSSSLCERTPVGLRACWQYARVAVVPVRVITWTASGNLVSLRACWEVRSPTGGRSSSFLGAFLDSLRALVQHAVDEVCPLASLGACYEVIYSVRQVSHEHAFQFKFGESG